MFDWYFLMVTAFWQLDNLSDGRGAHSTIAAMSMANAQEAIDGDIAGKESYLGRRFTIK